MNRSRLTEVLQDAGLSPYQAEAYVAVVELGAASATDIAEKCDVPDPRIYDVLRDLEDRGYVETYEQDSLHARAYNPDTVLADLRGRASEFEAAADEIEERWEAPEIDSHTVSFVKQIETVLDNAKARIRNSENQIQIAVDRDQYEWLRPALRTAKENGVHVSLVLQTDEGDTGSLPPESELSSVATEARHRTIPVPFIALVDRSVTLFAPHDLSANRYGIIVEDRTLAYVCHWFFQAGLWESTTPLYDETDDALPRTYVNIRKCIQDITGLLEGGAAIAATIEGIDIQSGAQETMTGEIVDIHYHSFDEADDLSSLYLGGQATIVMDTGEETVEIGGWGATIEDYEAIRIVLTEIRE